MGFYDRKNLTKELESTLKEFNASLSIGGSAFTITFNSITNKLENNSIDKILDSYKDRFNFSDLSNNSFSFSAYSI